MKKDKVYELRIEEDDEISGIDSISLVSEPAIEINWVAFNKVKPQEFHIPDGEDKKYLEFFNEKGQPEEELLNDGWVRVKEEFVSSSPNQPSFEDTNEFLVRYKYVKNPEAPGAAVKLTTREFCSDLISKNYVYRVEDMDAIINDEGDSALVWRGGYNCRHKWMQIKYRRDATIVNKGSVTKGRIDDAESYDVLGYPQPDTRVPEWPSFSKTKFEIVPPNLNVYGYHTRFFQICPGAQATFEHLVSMDNDEDTIGMIRSAAQVADNVFRIEDEVIKAEKATEHQYEEAKVLVDDFKDIIGEIDAISGMKHDVSYMDGHIVKIAEYLKEDLGYDVSTITGYVDEGIRKKKKKKEQLESYSDYPDSVKNNAQAVLKYVEENGWGSCGTDVGKQRANQLAKGEPISEDTIRRMYSYLSRHEVDLESSKGYGDGCGKLMYDSWGGKSALSWSESKINAIDREKMSKQKFQTDEEKRIVVGPAMVPDLKIYRQTKTGDPYYVTFKEDTIRMIADKYMRNKYIDNNDTEHNGKAADDVYVYESWIKEDEQDKSTKYGFGDLPIGTWFVSMKVRNDEVWKRIKAKELNGFSVSGFFEEIEQFKMEQQFLKELAEILKDL
jgi:hypothetical protein